MVFGDFKIPQKKKPRQDFLKKINYAYALI